MVLHLNFQVNKMIANVPDILDVTAAFQFPDYII